MKFMMLNTLATLLSIITTGAPTPTQITDAVAASAAANAAAMLAQLPGCAVICLSQALPASGCLLNDVNCQCNSDILWDVAGKCSLQACTTREALAAQRVTKSACQFPVRNEGPTLVIVTSVLFGLALAFVVVRIIARSLNRFELFGADDVLILLSFIFGTPIFVFDFFLTRLGFGQDIWLIPFENISRILFYFWIAEMPYLLATVLMKMSILAFYLRVFVDYRFRQLVFVTMGVLVAFTIAYLFPLIFQCSPISHAWNGWQKETKGTCINQQVGIWVHAALNIFFDLVVLVLPIPILCNLQFTYSIRAKLQILGMFSVGIVVTVVSILRLRALIVIKDTINPTYDYFGAGLWSVVEVQVGVVCACLPTARVFVSRILPKWIGLRSTVSSAGATMGRTTKVSGRKTPTYQVPWGSSKTFSADRSSHRIPSGVIETSTEFGTAEFLKLEDTPQSTNRDHLFRPRI